MNQQAEYLAAGWQGWAESVWSDWTPPQRTLRRLYAYAVRVFGADSEPAAAILAGIHNREMAKSIRQAQDRAEKLRAIVRRKMGFKPPPEPGAN